MEQIARNATDEASGLLHQLRYVLHDRDTKFCTSFRAMLATGNVKCLALPPRSPNLNAFVERWVRSVKQECLSRLVLFGEGSLRRALTEFLEHYHAERNHPGKGNVLLFPSKDASQAGPRSSVRRRHGRRSLIATRRP
jgi:putative transposase